MAKRRVQALTDSQHTRRLPPPPQPRLLASSAAPTAVLQPHQPALLHCASSRQHRCWPPRRCRQHASSAWPASCGHSQRMTPVVTWAANGTVTPQKDGGRTNGMGSVSGAAWMRPTQHTTAASANAPRHRRPPACNSTRLAAPPPPPQAGTHTAPETHADVRQQLRHKSTGKTRPGANTAGSCGTSPPGLHARVPALSQPVPRRTGRNGARNEARTVSAGAGMHGDRAGCTEQPE
jgi:hypothetical protein